MVRACRVAGGRGCVLNRAGEREWRWGICTCMTSPRVSRSKTWWVHEPSKNF